MTDSNYCFVEGTPILKGQVTTINQADIVWINSWEIDEETLIENVNRAIGVVTKANQRSLKETLHSDGQTTLTHAFREDDMTDRNLGKFTISALCIHQEPERVAEVFSILKLVPVRAELLFSPNVVEYTAISERFKEVPDGQRIPSYELKIHQSEAGNVELVEVGVLD